MQKERNSSLLLTRKCEWIQKMLNRVITNMMFQIDSQPVHVAELHSIIYDRGQ